MSELPTRLAEIIEDFQVIQGQEKLEYLLELSDSLLPLPDWLVARREEMEEVHECMTSVFVYAEIKENDRFQFHLDVPPEAPTVRGFAAILQQGLDNTTLDELMAVPTEFYLQMGLQQVLSGQRLTGIGAILAHIKRLARQAIDQRLEN
jgi:cysteine desulfuration protein SufE